MGLDMYLNKVTTPYNVWPNLTGPRVHVEAPADLKIKDERVSSVVERVGYWRKANAIHQWFVDNVQDGEDNCGYYYVSRENLEVLLETVNKVLDDHSLAEDLLPTQSGFFFGATDYDDYYFEDLKETKKIIEEIFAEGDVRAEYQYHSSW